MCSLAVKQSLLILSGLCLLFLAYQIIQESSIEDIKRTRDYITKCFKCILTFSIRFKNERKGFNFEDDINFNSLSILILLKQKVPIVFELGTCGLDRSYIHCATEIGIQV